MPIDMNITDHGLGVVVTGTGAVSEEEYLQFYRGVLAQGEGMINTFKYSLNDWSGVTSVSLSSAAIQEIANLTKMIMLPPVQTLTAVVAPADLTFGLSRMWQSFAEGPSMDIRVWRQRADAESWLAEHLWERFGLSSLTFR
jgi:hypothetical protein